jgi:mannose-6-phosphate isomerase-like protein (cupin superfamily)
MKNLWILVCLLAPPAAAQQAPQPAAKPLLVGHGPLREPAAPHAFISAKDIEQRIAQADALIAQGKMYPGEPLLLQDGHRVTMEWRNIPQDGVNQHEADSEMFVILEGSGAMTVGGHLVGPKRAPPNPWEGPTLTAKTAEGGTTYKVAKGDMLMIPKGAPHRVSAVDNGKLVLWSMILPDGPAQ